MADLSGIAKSSCDVEATAIPQVPPMSSQVEVKSQ